jgi:hypothetical protein
MAITPTFRGQRGDGRNGRGGIDRGRSGPQAGPDLRASAPFLQRERRIRHARATFRCLGDLRVQPRRFGSLSGSRCS